MRRTLRYTPNGAADRIRTGMVFHRGILSSLRTAYFATAAYLPTRADISRWYATIFTYKLNRQIICLNISSTNIFVFLQREDLPLLKD